jgi:hypothetical protein
MMAELNWDRLLHPSSLAVIATFLVPIVGVIAYYWARVQSTRSTNALKRTLAERGMSADEIERVVAARPSEEKEG